LLLFEDVAKAEKQQQQRALAPPPNKLEEAKRSEEMMQLRRELEGVGEKNRELQRELERSQGWEEREHKWREALRLLGDKVGFLFECWVVALINSGGETHVQRKTRLAGRWRRRKTVCSGGA